MAAAPKDEFPFEQSGATAALVPSRPAPGASALGRGSLADVQEAEAPSRLILEDLRAQVGSDQGPFLPGG